MDLGLTNIHVLITGASGGIGLETVKLYLSLGANVTAHYNSNAKPIQALQASFPALQCVQADLSSEFAVKHMFDVLSGMPFGPVAVVVVNHGIWPPEDVPIVDMTIKQWDKTISANLTSSFLVCREYLRHLRTATDGVKDKAAIVLIGSVAGKYGEANHGDYAISKSAMMYGLTMTLKNEIVKIAPRGRVNSIAPGWVVTPMVQEALNDPAVSGPALAATPLKKLATPLDIANQISVLSSSVVSGHVTGQVVFIEGGCVGDF
ncbi:NAD(P)-binding protein [Suillus paluster]|uniref:NAD(P)-binding protein n=1 Tax=Suillus paluster TaxID=48578 RepID=UPI001B881FEF|nr:NAD(P)-binding protein [Suillus paluster]KAG1728723.1 NAD(P)-binding protein [Suillus paluster]